MKTKARESLETTLLGTDTEYDDGEEIKARNSQALKVGSKVKVIAGDHEGQFGTIDNWESRFDMWTVELQNGQLKLLQPMHLSVVDIEAPPPHEITMTLQSFDNFFDDFSGEVEKYMDNLGMTNEVVDQQTVELNIVTCDGTKHEHMKLSEFDERYPDGPPADWFPATIMTTFLTMKADMAPATERADAAAKAENEQPLPQTDAPAESEVAVQQTDATAKAAVEQPPEESVPSSPIDFEMSPTKSEPVKASSPSRKKGAQALLKGFRTGELSKVVDQMEASEVSEPVQEEKQSRPEKEEKGPIESDPADPATTPAPT
jgi:hypothetical protein